MEVHKMSMRKQQRVNCDIILNNFGSKGEVKICRATDISLSGMRMDKLLDPYLFEGGSEKVRLEVELPGDETPIMIGAKKVWDSEEEFGVRFTNISHSHFVRLRSFLNGDSLVNQLPMFA